MPNPAYIISRFFRRLWRTGGIGRSHQFNAAMLTVILFAVVSCAESPIAEPGSRADRVFDMANEGDSTAQTALGLLYERGLGVPHDPLLALIWYRRAASQGDALAEFHIGSLYERGLGVGRDYSEAAPVRGPKSHGGLRVWPGMSRVENIDWSIIATQTGNPNMHAVVRLDER